MENTVEQKTKTDIYSTPLTRTISVDFDQVIHAYTKGYHDGSIYDPPIVGAFDTIRKWQKHGYGVFVMTARMPLEPIVPWFYKHGFTGVVQIIKDDVVFWNDSSILGVTNRKLPALAYIDDRAIRFVNWADAQNYFV